MKTHFWVDGISSTPGAARVDPASPLGAWGEGYFETARIHAGRILVVALHMDRMRQSLEASYAQGFDEQLFERVWHVARSAATRAQQGRLRIVATPVTSNAQELRYTATLTDWAPPDDAEYRRGVDVDFTSLPHPQLGAFGKSTSYHWARLGSYEARRRELDDVVFTDGATVIETTTASVVTFDGRKWSTPGPSSGGLDSTTVRGLELRGLNVHRARITQAHLKDTEAIALVSALRLAIGVRTLGDQVFTDPDKHVKPLRDLLLSSATPAE